jgi:alkane 1-monooxygenase
MKLGKKVGFFSAFIIPFLVILGAYAGHWWNFTALGFVFILIPLMDHLAGIDTTNIPQEKQSMVNEEFYYRFVTYVWTFVQFGFILWSCLIVSSGKLNSLPAWIGFVIGVSLVTGGIGITVAHELGHKKSRLERAYSQALLMTVCYMHFYIEHNQGHHVHVATPEDPATARKGENFYAFWVRSVFGGWWHAWKLERDRMIRNNQKVWTRSNRMIFYTLLPLVFCLLITTAFSYPTGSINWGIPLFFFVQSILAFTLLELVNYVEHYGIVRKINAQGKYERVNPLHSWNASQLISNFFLFQLQRHSDHHANAIKRYQVLSHYDESPQLPFGYPTMIVLALLPPVWFEVMDPRLKNWESKIYLAVLEGKFS